MGTKDIEITTLDVSTNPQQKRQERQPQERERRDFLAGFMHVGDGAYINAKTNEIAVKFIITYSNDDELWEFYLNHHEELDALIREKVPGISSRLSVKEIQVERGSIVLTVIVAMKSFAVIFGSVASAIAAYPAAKLLYQDLRSIILDYIRLWFGNGGPSVQPG
jgi:hypothetical protein